MKIEQIDEGDAERIVRESLAPQKSQEPSATPNDPRRLASAAFVAVPSIHQLVGKFSRNEWLPDFGGERIVGLKKINHITRR